MTTEFPKEKQDRLIPPVNLELMAQGVRLILEGLGEDPNGLVYWRRRDV